jgi:hypothetical protein
VQSNEFIMQHAALNASIMNIQQEQKTACERDYSEWERTKVHCEGFQVLPRHIEQPTPQNLSK